MNQCYVESCTESLLPFSSNHDDEDGFCRLHFDLDDIENLGHCPNCKSKDVTKSVERQETKVYTDYYKLTDHGFDEDEEIDDTDVDSNCETVGESLSCNDCDFERSWDYR